LASKNQSIYKTSILGKNIMKNVFIFLFLIVSIILQIGCSRDNSNQTNANSSPSAITDANQADANIKAEETQLPTFTDAQTALNEGKKLLDANETEKSIEALRQAVKINPDLAEAHFNLGIAYALFEKEQENAQTPNEELSTTKTTVTKKGKKEVVVLTASDKAFDNAAKIYEKITQKNPEDDAAFFNLGRSYNKLNKDEEAEKALRQAVKLKPEDSEYQTELGAILVKLSQYDDAVTVLKKAVTLDEANSYAQDLLVKAESGKKRINYGVTPKPQQTAKDVSKQKEDLTKQRPTPSIRIEEVPLPRTNSKP
jgi:tetratricopeptide (TPR) repeat protein